MLGVARAGAARARLVLLGAVAVVVLAGLGAPQAVAGGPVYQCNDDKTVCWPVVNPGGGGGGTGHGGGTGGGGGGDGGPLQPGQCVDFPMDPQPPKSSYVWEGHTDGTIFYHYCIASDGGPGPNGMFWAATPPVQVITPAQLAQRALGTLTVPDPVVHRSPQETNDDAGMPFTYVNLWTWFWTDPATWTPISRTASAGAVWATVTATPSALIVDPGDGSGVTTCTGPGRAWTAADGNAAPAGGACGVRYLTALKKVTSTLSIQWTVSWVGSDGGPPVAMNPPLISNAASTFTVEQIQVVNR